MDRPDRDQDIFKVLRAIRGLKPTDVASKTYVSAQTIRNWRKPVAQGGTRYPQHHTLRAVAAVAGLEFKLVEKESVATRNSRARGDDTRVGLN